MVKNWTEIEAPEFEQEGFIETLLDKTSILDILDKYRIEYMECRTGSFTHRGKCPFPLHADGDERTASFFISEDNSSFHCFGCNNGGSTIDFIKIYTGKPYYEAIKWLSEKSNITESDDSVIRRNRDPEKMILTHVMRSGIAIRDHLALLRGTDKYDKWCKWADKRFAKLDTYLEQPDENWADAKKYYDKIMNFINKR